MLQTIVNDVNKLTLCCRCEEAEGLRSNLKTYEIASLRSQ